MFSARRIFEDQIFLSPVNNHPVPLILSLDTSTPQGGAALLRGEALISFRQWGGEPGAKESHSARALMEIDFLLREAGFKISQIDLFASSTGPGSFTGLRIGLAMIKSFAATLERPCYGVSTLAALARGAGPREEGVVAILPAGRGELFAQTFGVGGEVRTLDEPVHLRPEALWERMLARPEPLFWCGPGVHLYSAQICDHAARKGVRCTIMKDGLSQVGDGWGISPARTVIACEVGALAAAAKKDQWLKAEELSALYVRRADPELKAESQKAVRHEGNVTTMTGAG